MGNTAGRSFFHTSCSILHISLYVLSPLLASAQNPIAIFDTSSPGFNKTLNFTGFANKLGGVANSVIPFLIGVAVVAIIWGIFRYIAAGSDAERIAEGRKTIIYGIGAIFLMLSFWGLVLVIKNSLFG